MDDDTATKTDASGAYFLAALDVTDDLSLDTLIGVISVRISHDNGASPAVIAALGKVRDEAIEWNAMVAEYRDLRARGVVFPVV